MKNFLIGLGFGIGIGLMCAPFSGSELRDNITDTAGDLADSARDGWETAKQKVSGAFDSAQSRVSQATGTEGIR